MIFRSRYSFDDEVFLSTEIDGLRIIQQDRCEFLERVPGIADEDSGKITHRAQMPSRKHSSLVRRNRPLCFWTQLIF